MKNNSICFEYEKLFGLPHSVGAPIMQDLMKRFGHSTGAFVSNDNGGRDTAYNLGQASVINYIIAQINVAKNKAAEENQ